MSLKIKALGPYPYLDAGLQTNWLYYCGDVETAWPKLVLTCPVNTKHLYDFMQCWTNIKDVGPTLYKYKFLVFAGQEDFLSNIVHLFNVGSKLGQCRRRRPSIKTA